MSDKVVTLIVVIAEALSCSPGYKFWSSRAFAACHFPTVCQNISYILWKAAGHAWRVLGNINIYLLSSLSPTDSSVVESRTSAAVMFRNSLKMLLTGGKANRKSRSSGESVLWCQPQTMTHLPVNTQKVLASSICVFLGSRHMQDQRMKCIMVLEDETQYISYMLKVSLKLVFW